MNIGEAPKTSDVSFEMGFPDLGFRRDVHVCEHVQRRRKCATDAAGSKDYVTVQD